MAASASVLFKVFPRDFVRFQSLARIHRHFRLMRTSTFLNYSSCADTGEKSDVINRNPSSTNHIPNVPSFPSYKQLKEFPLQTLMVMPFNVVFGGKFAIHLLQKYEKKRAVILVRAKVLASELCLELKENGISCFNANSSANQETLKQLVSSAKDDNFIIVASYEDAKKWKSFPRVELMVMVQPPMDGIPCVLNFLQQQNFDSSSGMAAMLYNENDFGFLTELQKYVDVTKLNPPSFFSMKQSNNNNNNLILRSSSMEQRLPSTPREEPLTDIQRPVPAKIPQYAVYRPVVPVPRASSERSTLQDYVRLYVRGGSGGQGSPTCAGLGGDGGDVVIQCQQGASFQHFSLKQNRRVIAGHGGHFTKEKRKKKGSRGLDMIVPVPPGTTLTTDDGRILAEMNTVGTRLLVARGGQGGSPSRESWCGGKGKSQMIRLDLKLMADVGLVGFPNAGKSSLLGELSRASVKTGDFPFTTVRPSIGMMEFSDHLQVSVADLPGLVEGAHVNRGMGHKFLKHIERTRILLLLIDVNGFQLSYQHPRRTAFQSLCLLTKELYSYDSNLAHRPKALVITKMDSDEAETKYNDFIEELEILKERGLNSVLQDIEPDMKLHELEKNHESKNVIIDRLEFEDIIPLSVISGTGIEDVRQRIRQLLTID